MPRPTPPPSPPPEMPCHMDNNGEPDLDKVIIVVAVVCAFLCALGLNSTLRCVVRCASRAVSEPAEWVAAHRLHSGLKSKDVAALPVSVHGGCGSHNSPAASSSSSSSGCAICLGEYSEGEKVRVLPKCNHRFHVVCIDKWLHSHSSCPTCRNLINSDSDDNILCTCLS